MKKNKSINTPLAKSFAIKQKAIGNDMVIKFNGAGFWNVDSDMDMILPEAFNQSIKSRGPESPANAKIAFCWQHEIRTPIGRITSMLVENSNLKTEAILDDIPFVKDTIIPQINSGTLNNTSIGYRYTNNCEWMSPMKILMEYGDRMPIDKKQELIDRFGSMNEDNFIYVCKELALHEISIVTIGANDDTEIFGGKSIEEVGEQFDAQIEELKKFTVGLNADEKYTTLQGLEKLKAIKNHFSTKQGKKADKQEKPKNNESKTFTLSLDPKVHILKM